MTQATEIHYDPDPVNTVIAEDAEFVRSYYELPEEEIDLDRVSPWLLRIELNREVRTRLPTHVFRRGANVRGGAPGFEN